MFSLKQVFPVNYEAEVSQRLLEACLSGDHNLALDCISDPFVDVNFVGAVTFKIRKAELVLHEESASEVRLEFEEFRTDVTPLFLAVHTGNVNLVKKLLVRGFLKLILCDHTDRFDRFKFQLLSSNCWFSLIFLRPYLSHF